MDLDLWDCFGRKNLCLITEKIWYTSMVSNSPIFIFASHLVKVNSCRKEFAFIGANLCCKSRHYTGKAESSRVSTREKNLVLEEQVLFSSPGRSPGRAIVLPLVSLLALAAAALAKC